MTKYCTQLYSRGWVDPVPDPLHSKTNSRYKFIIQWNNLLLTVNSITLYVLYQPYNRSISSVSRFQCHFEILILIIIYYFICRRQEVLFSNTLLCIGAVNTWILGRFLYSELEDIWKKLGVAYFKVLWCIFLEKIRHKAANRTVVLQVGIWARNLQNSNEDYNVSTHSFDCYSWSNRLRLFYSP
jgi:hypothetical protein